MLSLRPWFFQDLTRRDFPPVPCVGELSPVVAAGVKGLVNQSLDTLGVVPEAFRVADHTIVVPYALPHALERGDDLGKR
jgi:hypothetical protein